jgi:hypothetical protein
LFLADDLDERPVGDPDRTFVILMCAYASDLLAGVLPGPYRADDARRYGRACLGTAELLERAELDVDRAAHGANPQPGAARRSRRAPGADALRATATTAHTRRSPSRPCAQRLRRISAVPSPSPCLRLSHRPSRPARSLRSLRGAAAGGFRARRAQRLVRGGAARRQLGDPRRRQQLRAGQLRRALRARPADHDRGERHARPHGDAGGLRDRGRRAGGDGAIVLQRARVGAGALVAAGSVVGEGTEIPPGVLAAGTPAQVKRELAGSSAAGSSAPRATTAPSAPATCARRACWGTGPSLDRSSSPLVASPATGSTDSTGSTGRRAV